VQRAQARIDARTKIVEGAIEITSDAVHKITQSDLRLEDKDSAELAKSLMALTCSDDGNVSAVMHIA
jgi:hypothetical protein